MPGLTVVPAGQEVAPALADAKPDRRTVEAAATYARAAGADAVALAAINRSGARTALDRTVWLRAVALVVRSNGEGAPGEAYAYGAASTRRRLFLAGDFVKDDAALLREAAQQAARELAHALETGHERFGSRDARIAVLPAIVPTEAHRVGPRGEPLTPIPVPAVARSADVLLQPEIPFVADLLSAERCASVAVRLGVELTAGAPLPDAGTLLRVAQELGADYVFASRVDRIVIADRPYEILIERSQRTGTERTSTATAEAVLFRASDGAVVWRHSAEGATTARTEIVRGRDKLRGEGRCAMDAVRAAYAYLCFDFAEFLRRSERAHRANRLPEHAA